MLDVDYLRQLVAETERISILEYAEADFVIPDGPFRGRKFDARFQPYAGLLLEAAEDTTYPRKACLGPTQSGKTLSCVVVPATHALFVKREDIGIAAPTMEMARDKWVRDIRPAIEASRFAGLLPTAGAGSRSGFSELIRLKNGTSVRFFSGGGGDKTVAGYTVRNLFVTETDGMDRIKERSDEADRITQIEARTKSYGRRKNVWLECTPSTTLGRIWVEYENGTHTRILSACLRCGEWVAPEREHLLGWQGAETERQAIGEAYFICPACGERIGNNERISMLRDAQLVHERPESLTLSVRWSAWHNMFWDIGDIALQEWEASRRQDRVSAEREIAQFVWAVPIPPEKEDVENMIAIGRVAEGAPNESGEALREGVVPEWAQYVTVGCDVHAKLLYWTLVAWKEDGTSHVVSYGRIENPYQDHGQEKAVLLGLREFVAMARQPWRIANTTKTHGADGVLIDAGWLPDVVAQVCGGIVMPATGLSQNNMFRKLRRRYKAPEKRGGDIKQIGEGWHVISRRPQPGKRRVPREIEHDVDFGKAFVHRRLATPAGEPGAMSLFVHHDNDGHAEFLRQITAEKQIIKRGVVTWERERTQNHWLDATVLAATAARMLGVTGAPQEPKKINV